MMDQALSHLREDGAAVHAGGTDLLGCLRDGIMDSRKVVSITGLTDLTGIRETADGGLRLGCLTTISDLTGNPMIREQYPALAQGAAAVASPQLRNQGTLGGNLCQKPRCWYYRGEFHCLRKGGDRCFALKGENQFHAIFGHDNICAITHPSDTAPVLIALDARVRITGPGGRRTVPVADMHVPPAVNVRAETVLKQGEIITHVDIPPPPPGLYSTYRKIRARRAWDFALAGAALALSMEDGRIKDSRVVLSGAAPVPWRSLTTDQALAGRALDSDTITKAAAAAVAGAVPLRKNGYKVDMFRGMMEEELHKAAAALSS